MESVKIVNRQEEKTRIPKMKAIEKSDRKKMLIKLFPKRLKNDSNII